MRFKSTTRGSASPSPENNAKPFSELSKEVRKRPGAAAEIDARKRAIIAAVRLAELRAHVGKTQTQLAEVLGMTQANVSRIERSENLYLSTLAELVPDDLAWGCSWVFGLLKPPQQKTPRRGGEAFLGLLQGGEN